jgi:hypothetical protein
VAEHDNLKRCALSKDDDPPPPPKRVELNRIEIMGGRVTRRDIIDWR